jgi:hypothetical protein
MCANANSPPEYEGVIAAGFLQKLSGNLTRVCRIRSNGTSWGPSVGSCQMAQCAATTVSAPGQGCRWNGLRWPCAAAKSKLQLAAAPVLTAQHIDCCTNLTKAGGCASPDGSFGHVQTLCNITGESLGAKWTAGSGACTPLRDVHFRLDALHHGTESKASAMEHFRWLSRHIDAHGSSMFPRNTSAYNNGILTTVSVAVGPTNTSKWLPVHSDRAGGVRDQWMDGSDQWTIDTVPRNTSHDHTHFVSSGRAVAAFARTACRQHGYRSTPFVTNCAGLYYLLVAQDEYTPGSFYMDSLDFVAALCPRVDVPGDMNEPPINLEQCPTWLTVMADGDNPSTWMPPLIQHGWSFGSRNSSSWSSDFIRKGSSKTAFMSVPGPVRNCYLACIVLPRLPSPACATVLLAHFGVPACVHRCPLINGFIDRQHVLVMKRTWRSAFAINSWKASRGTARGRSLAANSSSWRARIQSTHTPALRVRQAKKNQCYNSR